MNEPCCCCWVASVVSDSVRPETAAHQAPPSLGFSRQEQWSGLPFPSPMHESEKWKWSRSVMSDSLRLHGLQPTRLLHPWDFPGKRTGVGCHCLLRCLYSRTLLFFYFIHISLHLPIPDSGFVLRLPSPLIATVCFQCLSVFFCFVNKFICFFIRFHM